MNNLDKDPRDEKPEPSSFRMKIFKGLPTGVHVKKFDLSVKKIKVIFFQTLLGPCPQCCILSPKAIGPLVPEIFKVFLPYMSKAAILIM